MRSVEVFGPGTENLRINWYAGDIAYARDVDATIGDSDDAEPPGWADREERWSIDELLGVYDPKQLEITIFAKGIEYAAQKMAASPDAIRYLVRDSRMGSRGLPFGGRSGKEF